jgi:uncharacterized protein
MTETIWRTRWSKEQILMLLREQFDTFWSRDTGVKREALRELGDVTASPNAVIITGLRRVGKSTLLAQLAHQLGRDQFYYLNFEDDQFIHFSADDFNDLLGFLLETFGERKTFLIDEIQNVEGWEHFVRSYIDRGYKFFITGSNASLLSQELGTRLTGRHVSVNLFPFSFSEFLSFNNIKVPELKSLKLSERASINKFFSAYLAKGGIPDILKYPELDLGKSLVNDILFRDIAARYQLESTTALKELGFYLMSNPASLISFNKLKEQIHVKSAMTVRDFTGYMENSWLCFVTNVFDYSVKRQQIAPKKVYIIDNGLSHAAGFHSSPDTGKMLENLVFLQLKRLKKQVYYLNMGQDGEVDFYLPDERVAIQVNVEMRNGETRNREVNALTNAVNTYPVSHALILTERNEDPLKVGNTMVEIRSFAEWLLYS